MTPDSVQPAQLDAIEKATKPIEFGVALNDSAVLFYFCLIAAVALVFFVCRKNFETLGRGSAEDDYLVRLPPRYLANAREYFRGLCVYVGLMTSAVCVLSLASPKDWTFLGVVDKNWSVLNYIFGIHVPPEIAYVAAPMTVALLLLGYFPSIPVLKETLDALEKWFRHLGHERAFIPVAARAMAETLSEADFDFSMYQQNGARSSAEMRCVAPTDFSMPRDSLEYRWARLSCLVYALERDRTLGNRKLIDGLLLQYATQLDEIEELRRNMENEVAIYRREKSHNADYRDYGLERRIRDALFRLYVLLGCAARNTKPYRDGERALQPFGFQLVGLTYPSDNLRLKLVTIAIMTAGVLLLGYAAVGLASRHLWQVSPFFPTTWYQPLFDTASAIALYGCAIFAADLVRTRLIKDGRWWRGGPRAGWRERGACYARLALVCGISGYVGTVLWGLAVSGVTRSWLEATMLLLIVPAVTGWFYVYHLDNAERQMRPSRLREIGWQAAATGICGFFSWTAYLNFLMSDLNLPFDQMMDEILYMTAISTLVGALLGWYIPQAAASTKHAPTVERSVPDHQMMKTA